MSREHLLLHMDDLPNMASVGQAPKMETLFAALHEVGFAAARVPDIDPFFVTDAPLKQVLETVRGLI